MYEEHGNPRLQRGCGVSPKGCARRIFCGILCKALQRKRKNVVSVRFLFKSYEGRALFVLALDLAEENFLNEQAFVMASDQRKCRQRSKFVCLKDSLLCVHRIFDFVGAV